eukprot:gnl/Hemi2/8738_TR3026_c0_g1_i1.p1 gnl/Hemi2/8738_TR3026_c0_g1~~gnl/Hemi2/8738_TR3026_c0_g1_i1.p1  ORF type:complete len:351 (+),score=80.51 gnl/Hemi2/8738_TR3026_c0_g1_i1:97-1053(+)
MKGKHASNGVTAYRGQSAPDIVDPEKHQRRTACKQIAVFVFFTALGLLIIGAWVVGIMMHAPMLGVLVTLAILPAFIIMYYMYYRDYSEMIDLELVIRGFLYGVLCVLPCAIVELLITYFVLGYLKQDRFQAWEEIAVIVIFLQAFVVAAFCEEMMKYFIACCVENRREVFQAYGIIIYALAGALGAATLENVGYILSGDNNNTQLATAIVRGILAVPLHGTTGALIGTAIVRRAFLHEDLAFYHAVAWPVVIHGSYDFLLLLVAKFSETNSNVEEVTGYAIGTMVLVFLIVVAGVLYTRRKIAETCEEADRNEALAP